MQISHETAPGNENSPSETKTELRHLKPLKLMCNDEFDSIDFWMKILRLSDLSYL